MILKNKQRTLVMALGIMIAIALVIGVLGYIDYSQNEVITRAVQDIPVDITAFQSTPDASQSSGFISYLHSYGSFITGAEFIETTQPLSQNPGVFVPTNTNASGNIFNLNGAAATLFGINMSYFNTFSNIFRVVNGSASSFTNSSVFISQGLSYQAGITQNENINVTVQSLTFDFQTRSASVSLLKQNDFNVTGIVSINSKLFQNTIDSFTSPSSGSSSVSTGARFTARFPRITSNIIFMDINTYQSFINDSSWISFGGFQIRVDHSQLSSDTTLIGAQISQLENYIQNTYPDYTFVSDLQNTITAQASQLDNLRLTLVYLTLPSIFIGFMLTKYATDLVLLERKKEITALRAKSLSQSQIRDYIVIESLLSALFGTLLGICLGYAASFLLNNFTSNLTNITFAISQNSIIIALVLGLGLAIISGLYTANTIMNQSVIEGLVGKKGDSRPFWIRYYIDLILLGIGVLFSIFSIINFNPVPGFAAAAFDLIVPIATWIGATLFLVRMLETMITKVEPIISKLLGSIVGDIGSVITKGIVRKPDKFNQLTIILILILSFGVVVGSISSTYQVKAASDASFAVGSDLRINLPATDQLTYNTSDFLNQLTTTFPDISFTPVIVSTFRGIPVIGIDTKTFLSSAYFQDSFLKSGNSSANAIKYLIYNPTNPTIIVSNSIANPVTGNRLGQGRFGGQQFQNQAQLSNFVIGGVYRASIQSQLVNFTISDISYYFPGIANFLNQPADTLRYAIVDYRTLTDSLTGVNKSIISNSNATFILGSYPSNGGRYNSSAIAQQINNLYTTKFQNAYPIVVNTQADYLATSTTIGSLLVDLANLELIIVLVVTIFSLGIYTTTTLLARKKIFGTLNALGAKLKSIWYIITGEMLIGILYSIVISLFLGLMVSYTYLGFISNLFILPYTSLSLSPVYSLMIYSLAIIGLIIISGYAVQRIFRMEPVEALREL